MVLNEEALDECSFRFLESEDSADSCLIINEKNQKEISRVILDAREL